jgi:signal transduction histidine kinase
VKYTDVGGRVTGAITSGPDGVAVAVTDTGRGIPQADLDRVFERFYRVDHGRSSDTGGTGLGLSIVRNVVNNHGGNVEVESQEGVGTTFTITLPASGETEAT